MPQEPGGTEAHERSTNKGTSALADGSEDRLTAKRLSARERVALTIAGIRGELTGTWRLSADLRSFGRLVTDALGYRAKRILPIGGGTRRHTVRFRNGTELTYRPNRGDVRAIAEVWMSEAYELPFEVSARNVIDLGANIGAASVWLMRRYGGVNLVAVEPVPDNVELTRVNLERNGIDGEVIEAAIAPTAGTARFEVSDNPTLGRIGENGIEVALVTPQSLVDRFPATDRIDLVKIDVEGAEQALFNADLSWLDRVDCLVIELHADRVDYKRITTQLEELGFAGQEIGERNQYRGLTDLMVAFRRVDIAGFRAAGR
jgi:FkbM family methyltransferase